MKVGNPEKDYGANKDKTTRPLSYKLSMVWDIALIILGAIAIFFSNRYNKHYAFECETFLVDTNLGNYHFNTRNGCEEAKMAKNIEKMKGFELEATNYTLCDWCKDWADDAEVYYESNRYFRR